MPGSTTTSSRRKIDDTEKHGELIFVVKLPFFGSIHNVRAMTLAFERALRFTFPRAQILRVLNDKIQSYEVISVEGKDKRIRITSDISSETRRAVLEAMFEENTR